MPVAATDQREQDKCFWEFLMALNLAKGRAGLFEGAPRRKTDGKAERRVDIQYLPFGVPGEKFNS